MIAHSNLKKQKEVLEKREPFTNQLSGLQASFLIFFFYADIRNSKIIFLFALLSNI